MPSSIRFAVPLALALVSAPLGAQRAAPASAAIQRGRTLTHWLSEGAADSVFAVMSPRFRESVGGREGLVRLAGQFSTRAGAERELVHEAAYHEAGKVDYYRIARYANQAQGTLTVRWVWDEQGTVVGAQVAETPQPAASQRLDYQTRAPLRLPFSGEWYVAWGGREVYQNKHAGATDQRFAYDLLVMRDGMPFTGTGQANEEHFCWGQPVLAPAAGTVAVAVDSVQDNRPGVMNRQSPPGNYVVLDHGNGEFSLLAHFRRGSVAVKKGDRVRQGARLGVCGNSGNSSLPHLHYHLQTGADYQQGEGLPAFFNGYTADGQRVARGEPVRGQIIRANP